MPESAVMVVAGAEFYWIWLNIKDFIMMVLYSGTTCPFSQRCRFVLFEKGMDFEVRDVDLFQKPDDIMMMNPYGQLPILVDRELVLYESNIINEYIDEVQVKTNGKTILDMGVRYWFKNKKISL